MVPGLDRTKPEHYRTPGGNSLPRMSATLALRKIRQFHGPPDLPEGTKAGRKGGQPSTLRLHEIQRQQLHHCIKLDPPSHSHRDTQASRSRAAEKRTRCVSTHTHKNRHTPSQSAINRVSTGSLLTITVMIISHPTLTRPLKHSLSTVYSLTRRPRAQAVSSPPDTAVLFLPPPYRRGNRGNNKAMFPPSRPWT